MASFTKAKRKKIYTSSNGVCFYCGCDIELDYRSDKRMEIDHINPKSNNGSNKYENLVASCMLCNRQKKGRDIKEWVNHLEEKVHQLRLDADKYESKLLKLKTNQLIKEIL